MTPKVRLLTQVMLMSTSSRIPKLAACVSPGMVLTFRLRQPLIRPLVAGSSTPSKQPRNLKRKVGEGGGKSLDIDIRSFYRSQELSEQAPSYEIAVAGLDCS
jgi:hypothetical protein